MSSETNMVQMDPRQLPADSFTDSDIARIQLVSAVESVATRLGGYAQMVGEDLARSGDYLRALPHGVEDSVIRQAVITERVRGTSWETIGEALRMSATDAEEKWGDAEAKWRRESRATDPYRKNPGGYAASADRYITTDKPYQFGISTRRPLSASLDAAAHLTGRDVAAADRAFAGTPACTHCAS
ncbi:hypothetical protein ACFV8E_41075 [Streptomyces sp. NPDC059849]|uniref:hypothetical protein n=1 Tax=Streptomyces sp. NPDC059849 TaxID=3346969 RepID=UPI003658E3C1